MKNHTLVIILLVTVMASSTYAMDQNCAGWLGVFGQNADTIGPSQYRRLEDIAKSLEIADLTRQDYFSDVEALLHVYDLKGGSPLIPQNGVLHVIGPRQSSLEWVLPLMSRKDIRIIVSEPKHDRQYLIEAAWEQLLYKFPQPNIRAKYGLENRDNLIKRITNQVLFYSNHLEAFESHPDGFDLILSLYPDYSFRRNPSGLALGLKDNGVLWVVSEWVESTMFPEYYNFSCSGNSSRFAQYLRVTDDKNPRETHLNYTYGMSMPHTKAHFFIKR